MMKFTLATLKRCAIDAEADLFVLTPGRPLPDFSRPGVRREIWLCVTPESDRRLAYLIASRFDKIFIFTGKAA